MTFERTLLIVDDEVELANLWSELLGASGWTCRSALGLTGVDAALRSGFQPRALLVDWSLGSGTGAEVIDRVRAAVPELAVIVCSGDESRIPAAVRGAALATLRKPFRAGQVAALLATI